MTPYLIAGALAAGLSIGGYAGWTFNQARHDDAMVRAQQQAKQTEDQHNAKLAKQNQAHADAVRVVNRKLADALERLRKRPERLPEDARAACEGGTGAELSGQDAGFLEREAARADELRAALDACYGWIDSVKQKF
jgi:hypothetical protein